MVTSCGWPAEEGGGASPVLGASIHIVPETQFLPPPLLRSFWKSHFIPRLLPRLDPKGSRMAWWVHGWHLRVQGSVALGPRWAVLVLHPEEPLPAPCLLTSAHAPPHPALSRPPATFSSTHPPFSLELPSPLSIHPPPRYVCRHVVLQRVLVYFLLV